MSTIDWSSDQFMQGLREMFFVKDNEIISSITIGMNGITASFRRK